METRWSFTRRVNVLKMDTDTCAAKSPGLVAWKSSDLEN